MVTRTLLYHDVVRDGRWTDSGFSAGHANIYKLTTDDFAAHLDRLRRVAPAPHLATDGRRGGWMITFDDGGSSALLEIAPRLEMHGWRGHFFMTTGWIGEPGFLDEAGLREMARRGHVIGSHSVTHPLVMAACPPEQLRREWHESVARLTSILGTTPVVASIPGGAYSDTVAAAAGEAGIRMLFTSEPTARSWRVGPVTCLGRYTLWRGMSPDAAANFATGTGLWPVRQRVQWEAKKLAKTVLGSSYQAIRERMLA